MNILVTGGAGYIGSHTCLELLAAGHEVTVVDNLGNSKREALRRVEQLAGKPLTFHEADILDKEALRRIFGATAFDAVIHFAAFKNVGESVGKPWEYYENNVAGSLTLFRAMAEHGVFNLVFSSSCTVYGIPATMPITEEMPTGAANCPYGWTKLMMEQILKDMAVAEPRWRTFLLRYFNPVGAHESGAIGEDPNGIPGNLMPFITQVAVGRLNQLQVFGNDYPTHDGTGVRDYIHVVDLALGHVKALNAFDKIHGCEAVNLGTGTGYSVLDVIAAFEGATGKTIPYRIAPRRPGDVPAAYANPAKAARLLGWVATRDLPAMCRDAWRWQSLNPSGYANALA
ncbi:MAG: UDP-glucose 4-epimerase GalE [Kiritimatiellaeota bacterium]|nr:UDP-glucose 4-epimerase GalE [Kiritimatiellota bacterium]